MTDDDIKWILSALEEESCFDCDLFDKCQEENRDYCEKESEDQ